MPCTFNTVLRNAKLANGLTEAEEAEGVENGLEMDVLWETIPEGMKDPIFKMTKIFHADRDARRVNLSVGVYQNGEGRQVEFEAVRDARRAYENSAACTEHGYLPPTGHAGFCEASARLVFGGSVGKARLTTVQTISGSGALRLAMEFSRRFLYVRRVYLSDPTWANHMQLAKDVSLKVSRYRYYDERTGVARSEWVVEDLKHAEMGSLVVFQACGHNPTGADLSRDGWRDVLKVVQARKLIALFDVAYQGLVSGDAEADVASVREFGRTIGVLVAHSLSKSMGLYGERVGTLSIVTPAGVSVARADSQLQYLIRGLYSSPPSYGANLAHSVLADATSKAAWMNELAQMVARMRCMRETLVARLNECGAHGRWDFIRNGSGMFACLGLTELQVTQLRRVHHVYLTEDSRVNLAGLTEHNVDRVASAIYEVASNLQRG